MKTLLVVAFITLGIAGCGGVEPGVDAEKADAEKTVVAAFYPLAWAAEHDGARVLRDVSAWGTIRRPKRKACAQA